jgi:glycosyltransferase A (GT-A) superfamily protein (DUF2064 family)
MTSESNLTDPAIDTCVVLCLKSPTKSKRRLAEEIGELATTAAVHLWACALETLQGWPGKVCYAPADTEDAAWLGSQLNSNAVMVLQRGENLGERINYVDAALRAKDEMSIIFIGTDCPAMEDGYLQRAAVELVRSDVVLGPAIDGGVVLMGARVAWPTLAELPWSTSSLCAALTTLCIEHGLVIANLKPRADVDSVAALLATRNELAQDPRPARRALSQWLKQPNAAWD